MLYPPSECLAEKRRHSFPRLRFSAYFCINNRIIKSRRENNRAGLRRPPALSWMTSFATGILMPTPLLKNAQTTLREFSAPSPRQMPQISHSAITPSIDYRLALAVHRELAGDDPLPRYLLAPEVVVLLGAVPDLHRRMLFEFIWNTGARINEALAVRPDDIVLDSVRPHVRLMTLKRQRNPKPGKSPANAQRRVPLLDEGFVSRLRDHLITFCPNRRRPVWEGRGGKPVTDDTARNWLSGAVAAIARQGISLSLPDPRPTHSDTATPCTCCTAGSCLPCCRAG